MHLQVYNFSFSILKWPPDNLIRICMTMDDIMVNTMWIEMKCHYPLKDNRKRIRTAGLAYKDINDKKLFLQERSAG